MVRFIDLKEGDELYAINLENKKLVIIETPYIVDFGCLKGLILPIASINEKYPYFIINLYKSKQSISFTDRFIFISDKKVLKYFINLRD